MKKCAGNEDPLTVGKGGIHMRCGIGVIMVVFMLLVSPPINLWAEHEQKNIDEIMSARQKEIDLAFSDFRKTKAASKLSEIEKLNKDAGSSLIEWWDLSHMPCCIDKDSDVKKTWEEDRNKLAFYLKGICANYTKIAGYYGKKNMTHKAQSIYQYITEAFDGAEFDKCIGEAKAKLKGFRN